MKKKIRLSVILILAFLLVGCENNDKEAELTVIENSDANTISIYYPDGSEIKEAKEKYQLKQPDSVSASVEEVMAVMAGNFGETVQYHTYMLDVDNNVSLDFFVTDELSKEYKLLTKASIAETLFQINGINSIKIKFMDQDGNTIEDGLYLPESFYFYN